MDVHKEAISIKTLSTAVFTLLLAVASLEPLSAQVQGQWVSTGTMQSGRYANAQVRLATGGEVLSIGGVDNNGALLASAEVYNPSLGTWKFTIGSMAEARKAFPAVVLTSGKVLISGGWGAAGVLAGAELYDPKTGLWSGAGSLSVARWGHTATLLTSGPDVGKVLVTGGCTTTTSLICTSTATAASELYDPATNSWSETGSLNRARGDHTAVLLKTGKVLVIGGAGSFGTNISCELYDPGKGTWSIAASTNGGRYLNTTTLLGNGKVLVTGGADGTIPERSAELYDPTANKWTVTGSMTNRWGRYAHTATLLTDGTVLVAGGIGQPTITPTATTEIYNQATGTFTVAVSLPQAVAYHSMTLLATGRALVNGGEGFSTCCVVVNNAEVFTPLTMTFSPSSLNFGLLQIGLSSPSRTVTVANVSSHSATISSIGSSGDYSQKNDCPITPNTLKAGQYCTIRITFTPTAAGTRKGAVTLHDNDPGSPTQTITLTGTGGTLALVFAPGSVNLGSVPVGSTATQSATLTNDSEAPVNITGMSISPAGGTFTQTNDCPATLNVQHSCAFQIVFAPPDVSNYHATLSVSNGAGGPATLLLSGTGLDGP